MKPPMRFKLVSRSLIPVLERDMPHQPESTTKIIDVITYRGVTYARTGIQGNIVTYVEAIIHHAE